MLHTISQSSKYNNLNVHLNNNSVMIIARNVLILKTVHHPDFNVKNETDLKYLWDVWYNLEWSKATCSRFIQSVTELCNGHLPENCVVSKGDLKKLLSVWHSWITKASEINHQKMETIKRERLELDY